MPLCARCFGLVLGVLSIPLFIVYVHPVLWSCLVGLLILDGVTQWLKLRESSNWLRVLTGIGFSGSIGSLLFEVLRAA
jgi:uncharacterized membrane protein